jgi:chromosomal replication initiation ATPase DnaA
MAGLYMILSQVWRGIAGNMSGMNEKAEALIDCVLCVFGLEREELMNSRRFPLPVIRGMIYDTLIGIGCSTTQAGRYLGRDRTTVIYMVRRTRELIEVDKEVKKIYEKYKTIVDYGERKSID